MGDFVNGLLQHDSLRNDQHHVGSHEQLTSDGRVFPLPAAVGAAEEIASVDEDAAPNLNGNVADDKHELEPEVDGHLAAEHALGELIGALSVLPVEHLLLLTSANFGKVVERVFLLLLALIDDGSLSEEEVTFAVDE